MAMSDATAPTSPAQKPVSAYSWVVLLMLLVIYVFNFLDRQLMSILQEPIKEELGLSDGEIGLMTGFFFALFYTVFGVIVGFLADRTSRKRILWAGCFLWSLFTALCGMAKNYPTMMVARMGVGVGEAAGAPPSYSIISDYFPEHRRGFALAIFSLGVPIGMALGAAFGAKIHELWGWRSAFIGIGIAGVIASFIMLFVVKEPKRGAQDMKVDPHMEEAPTQVLEEDDKAGFIPTILAFFSNRVLMFTALGAGFSAFAGYAALHWNVSFLIRVKGIDYGQIAVFYSMLLAVCMGLGTLLSGGLVDWLSRRSKAWYGILPAVTLALCVPFHLLYIYAPTWQMALVYLSVPTFLSIFYLAPAIAVVQNAAKPNQRTMAGALLLMVLNIIGLGGGPTFVGYLSDFFYHGIMTSGGLDPAALDLVDQAKLAAASDEIKAAHAAATADGLKRAMLWVTPFFIFASFFLVLEAIALGKADKKEKAEAAA